MVGCSEGWGRAVVPTVLSLRLTLLYSRLKTLGKASNTTLGRDTGLSFRDANLCKGSELIDRQQDNKLGTVNEPGWN